MCDFEVVLNAINLFCSLKSKQVTDSCSGRAEVTNTPVSQVDPPPVEPGAAACHWQHPSPIVVWSQQV